MNQVRLRTDIGEGAVAIIFVQAIGGLLAGGKAFRREPFTKKISANHVVVIVESDATASSLQQISVFMLAATNRFGVEASFLRNVTKLTPSGADGEACAGGLASESWKNAWALSGQASEEYFRGGEPEPSG
jgi:hypothetical protein